MRTSLAVDEPEAAAVVAELLRVPVEATADKTDSTAEYVLPDGGTRVDQYLGPEFVESSATSPAGVPWDRLSVLLHQEPSGELVPDAYPRHFELSGGGREPGTILSAALGDGSVTLELTWPGPIPRPRLDGGRAVYEAINPGVDLVVDLRPSGFEHYFVVHSPEAAADPANYELGVAVSGGYLDDSGDEIRVFSDSGAVVATFPAAFAWDAANDALQYRPVLQPWDMTLGNPERADTTRNAAGVDLDVGNAMPKTERVDVTLTTVSGGTRMRLAVDPNWLAADSTRYPVVLDPVVYPTSRIKTGYASPSELDAVIDTTVSSQWPSNAYYADEDFRIGTYNSGTDKNRAYVSFGLGGFDGKKLYSAKFNALMSHSWSCTAKSWKLTAAANVSTSTKWSAQPAIYSAYATSTTTKGYSSSCADAWVAVTVTSVVQSLIDRADSVSSYSLRLTAGSETDNFYWKRFVSEDSGSGYRPYLSYVINRKPTAPTELKVDDLGQATNLRGMDGYPLELTGSAPKPKLSAKVSDPDGTTVTPTFEVQRAPLGSPGSSASWVAVGSPAGASTASGAVATYTMTGAVAGGYEYRFRVKAKDPYETGSASVWYYFRKAVQGPSAPADVRLDGQAMTEGIVTVGPGFVPVFSAIVTDATVGQARLRLAIIEDGVPLTGEDQGFGAYVASGQRALVSPAQALQPGRTYTFELYANNGFQESDEGAPITVTYVVQRSWPSEVPGTCDDDVGATNVTCSGGQP